MGWRETRATARDAVHAAFGVPATYYAPGSETAVPVNVRHHSQIVPSGDLEREGYADQIIDVNRVVFDTTEVSPVRKGRVVMPDDDVLYLEVFERLDSGRYAVWNVVRERA